MKKYFDCSFQYRHIYEKTGDKWLLENRPQIGGTIHIPWNRLIITDSQRLEYRIRENRDNIWRYRNRLAIELACKWTSMQIQPYGAYEIFFDFSEKKINRNRVYLGFKLKFFQWLKGELYYMLQSSIKREGDYWHIMGTKIQLTF